MGISETKSTKTLISCLNTDCKLPPANSGSVMAPITFVVSLSVKEKKSNDFASKNQTWQTHFTRLTHLNS